MDRRWMQMSEWQTIETAPRNGERVLGRMSYIDRLTGKMQYARRQTYYGKTSHVPLYGWNYGRDPENQNLWEPTHWMPLPEPPIDGDGQ